MSVSIPFNKPFLTGKETEYIEKAVRTGKISGNGYFTQECQKWFCDRYGFLKTLLATSCTDALEMCAILSEVKPGDEVIVPSYTFVSTALAFVREGADIVFADSYPDNPNIDADAVEGLITERTKAIVPVHYAGVACEMDRIMEIAAKHGLAVVEDAAQGVMSSYKGKALGTIGDFGCYSFHETKNYSMGEGGALLIRDDARTEDAEIIREKGTNRSKFFRGQIDKYTWVNWGSSYLPSDMNAAYLWAQLEQAEEEMISTTVNSGVISFILPVWDISFFAIYYFFTNDVKGYLSPEHSSILPEATPTSMGASNRTGILFLSSEIHTERSSSPVKTFPESSFAENFMVFTVPNPLTFLRSFPLYMKYTLYTSSSIANVIGYLTSGTILSISMFLAR